MNNNTYIKLKELLYNCNDNICITLCKYLSKNSEKLKLDYKYDNGETIFHLIAKRGLDEVLDFIKKIFNRKIIKKCIDIPNQENIYPLQEASCFGYTNVCKKLLDMGANINITTLNNNTAIHFSIINGHQETTKFLIKSGANLNIENNQKKSPYKLIFKYMKILVQDILDMKRKYLARVSIGKKIYNKNRFITNKTINYNKNESKIIINLDKNKKKFCKICKKKKKNKSKIIPIDDTIRRITSTEKENKISNLKNIKRRKILVEYNYTEITDYDINKFVKKEIKEIVTHDWFQTLMDFYWYNFAKTLFRIQLGLYILFTIIFFINNTVQIINNTDNIYNSTNIIINNTINFTNYIINFTNYTINSTDNTINSTNQILFIINILTTILLIIINTFYLINEIFEICKKKKNIKNYFTNKWNLFDIFQIILLYISLISKFILPEIDKILLSVLYPIFLIKFLSFTRGFKHVGPIVRVIFNMLRDIYNFMTILSVFIIGFSQAFYILMYNNILFNNPFTSIITTFDMVIGNFDTSVFNESSNFITVNILYRIYIIISVIMLFNMLIAILENSYTKIIEEAEKEWKIERAKLILSLMDSLMTYKNKFTTVKDINCLFSLEIDNKPIKGIENYQLLINMQ